MHGFNDRSSCLGRWGLMHYPLKSCSIICGTAMRLVSVPQQHLKLAKRGKKDVQDTLGGSGRDYITVLGAGCADGTRLPPFVAYKGKNLWSRWMQGGPDACMFSVSDSGWMEAANFLQWFEMFLPAVKHLPLKMPVLFFRWSPFTHEHQFD